MSALEDYVATSDFEQFQSTVMTTLSVMAGTIEMNFYETTSEISDLTGRHEPAVRGDTRVYPYDRERYRHRRKHVADQAEARKRYSLFLHGR